MTLVQSRIDLIVSEAVATLTCNSTGLLVTFPFANGTLERVGRFHRIMT